METMAAKRVHNSGNCGITHVEKNVHLISIRLKASVNEKGFF